MQNLLIQLLDRLDSRALNGTDIIRWSCPVPAFGDIANAQVATLGINPSNREFQDSSGAELTGSKQRLPTLRSLGLGAWADADFLHLRKIIASCSSYFMYNPYDTWFRVLDNVVQGANASYYSPACSACHVDLVPYATKCKWTELSSDQKQRLLEVNADTLGFLLRDSPIRALILNGRAVVSQFEALIGSCMESTSMPSWSLPRKGGPDVTGISYKTFVTEIAGVELDRPICVLGFNHNLQSSFGVTNHAIGEIRHWISNTLGDMKYETEG